MITIVTETRQYKKLVVGLVEGRHELPVDAYIYGEIQDVLDFDFLQKRANEFISQLSEGDSLVVYVTGLTAATAAVITACMNRKVHLVLKHYDRETGSYKNQCLF